MPRIPLTIPNEKAWTPPRPRLGLPVPMVYKLLISLRVLIYCQIYGWSMRDKRVQLMLGIEMENGMGHGILQFFLEESCHG